MILVGPFIQRKLQISDDMWLADIAGNDCNKYSPRVLGELPLITPFNQSGSTLLPLYLQKSKSNASSLSKAVCLGPRAMHV